MRWKKWRDKINDKHWNKLMTSVWPLKWLVFLSERATGPQHLFQTRECKRYNETNFSCHQLTMSHYHVLHVYCLLMLQIQYVCWDRELTCMQILSSLAVPVSGLANFWFTRWWSLYALSSKILIWSVDVCYTTLSLHFIDLILILYINGRKLHVKVTST